MAKFLVEIPNMLKNITMVLPLDPSDSEVSHDIWVFHTHRAASNEGLGACLILKNPHDDEITYAL